MFCLHCGTQITATANFCSACGAPTPAHVIYAQPRIVRLRHPRMIAGLCSGVALHYGWNLTMVRVLLVVFTFLTSGLGILVYIAGWLLIPDAPYALPATTQQQTTSTL